MRRTFTQVDVFAEQPCLGNPVAVVHDAEGLDDDDMLRFTRWTNLSEATFVLPPTDGDADYRVRIFTQSGELPFAGHPTLGTCHAWLAAGGRPRRDDVVVQECEAGLVQVRQQPDGRLAFAGPPLRRAGEVEAAELAAACAVLWIDPDDIVDAAWTDNGPGWMTILLSSAMEVLAVRPDAAPGREAFYGVVGLHPPGVGVDLEVRGFFTDAQQTLREDPVTGSLNAAVGAWLVDAGHIRPPYVAAQGTALGREGRVAVSREGDTTWVAGRCRSVVEGAVEL